MNKMKEILSRSGSAEMMIIYYMLDKGIENLKSITEDDIKTVRGNGLMTEEFCQSIVRTAVRIANECETYEILEYIRCEAFFNPKVKEIEIGKEAMSDYSCKYLCDEMDVDPEETDYMKLKFIVEEQ